MSTTPAERIYSSPERYHKVLEAIYEFVPDMPAGDMHTFKVRLADLMRVAKSVGYDFALLDYEFKSDGLDGSCNPFYDEEKSD